MGRYEIQRQIVQEWASRGVAKKSAQKERNNFQDRKINPLAMQRRGECATAEPSGRRFAINASYIATYLRLNGLVFEASTLHTLQSRQNSVNVVERLQTH